MEITIGVRDIPREITIESPLSADELRETVRAALDAGTALELTDEHGVQLLVPGGALGYVRLGSETPRRVGFGV
ncbi:MAG TPA: DUF3107 domain-containing protein [Phototrophicaceae bacterium]|nr:DUF3107 domain-containing protein [Phototrophicaceae bacterium]